MARGDAPARAPPDDFAQPFPAAASAMAHARLLPRSLPEVADLDRRRQGRCSAKADDLTTVATGIGR